MIDIPVGKALAAVESEKTIPLRCEDCAYMDIECIKVACLSLERKDGKDVFYKLVDYKGDGKC